MGKKTVSALIVIMLSFAACIPALAKEAGQPAATREALKSGGVITYEKGTESVTVDAGDLYVLADRLDEYKRATAGQLASMNTYFTTEERGITLTSGAVNVVHTKPESEVNPLTLDFDVLAEGIAASQSIPADLTEYGYPENVPLYKDYAGELTTDAGAAGAEPVSISAATADNLSAGCAAWTQGELLLGNGADNKAYYQKGYVEGYNKVVQGVNISYIYHVHDGSVNEAGECFAAHTHTDDCYTERTVTYACPICGAGDNPMLNGPCRICGATYVIGTPVTGKFITCGKTSPYTQICGKNENTIEQAVIVFQ